MNVKQIEEKYGLPARIRIPIKVSVTNMYGSTVLQTEFIRRTITKRLENGHYSQYDDKQPHLGEFQCCYSENLNNDWEYDGIPNKEQLPSYF